MSLLGEHCAGPPYDAWCPQPLSSSCSQPCVTSCPGSRVIIYPPPVIVTFPGPILSTCPQETLVGSSAGPEGCPPSLRAGALCSEPPLHYEPQRPPRTTYIYESRWIHPCNRPSYLRYSAPASQKEEHPPEKEKPKAEDTGMENTGSEETESSAV